jgi:exodeoxyribonuclease I
MKKTFLFYDLETSGLNKAFDQIIQFAAIRTDMDFNEISRHELMIKPNIDVIPSPYAAITHQTDISDWQKGEDEFSAIAKIHKWFNTPGTISIGYNTLGFDDEFLRFNFYKNLLPPYTHQFANACQRVDLYPIAALYSLFKTDVLKWPIDEETQERNLKLENISQLNKLASGQAHTAIVDVEATVALAKCFAKEKAMWDYCLGYFDKTTDSTRMHSLNDKPAGGPIGILVEGILGKKNRFHAPALYLGTHRHYKNQVLWLRLDEERLQQCNAENFKENTWVINKKLGEPPLVLPFDQRYQTHLGQEREDILQKNLQWLEKNPTILMTVKEYYLDYKYPAIENVDIDAALYLNGFLSAEDQKHCQQFHKNSDKGFVIEQMRSPVLQTLAVRALARLDREKLTDEQEQEFQQHIDKLYQDNSEKIIDYKNQEKLTLANALVEIDKMQSDNAFNKRQKTILQDLKKMLEERGL